MSIYPRRSKSKDTEKPSASAQPRVVLNSWVGMTEPSEEDASKYSDWAERMRAKRSRSQAVYEPEVDEATPNYWATDNLFRDSERLGHAQLASRPDPTVVHELFSVLDLRDGASEDEVSAAYKRLVKKHHPDRYVGADEATRSFHEERIRDINMAYHALREILQS